MATIDLKSKKLADSTLYWGVQLRTCGYITLVLYELLAVLILLVGLFDKPSYFYYFCVAFGLAITGLIIGALFIALSSYIMMNATVVLASASNSEDFAPALDIVLERNPSLTAATTPDELMNLRVLVHEVAQEMETRSLLDGAIERQQRFERTRQRKAQRVMATNAKATVRGGKAKLGVSFSDKEGGSRLVVDLVVNGSPAMRAGIVRGDQIMSISGVAIANVQELMSALGEIPSGTEIDFEILRSDQRVIIPVTL